MLRKRLSAVPTEERPEPRRAIALGYDSEADLAPRVLATGRGQLAEHILAAAQANGVPIREDRVLAAALATVDLDQTIPPELYAVVAEVLVYIYRVKEKARQPMAAPQALPKPGA